MIDASAVIDPAARIADDVQIGPWTIIGPEVEIGAGTTIGVRNIIKGPTKIGCNNQIFASNAIGNDHSETFIEIGDNNIIREFSTVEPGSRIGNDNFIMSCVQIGSHCVMGNHNIFINHVSIAENVTINDYVNMSGFVTIDQFCTIGSYSFIGAGCNVAKDILPYLLVDGHVATTCGLNVKGLQRNGFSSEIIRILKRAYKIIFRNGLTESQVIEQLNEMRKSCSPVKAMMEILQRSSRGIVR